MNKLFRTISGAAVPAALCLVTIANTQAAVTGHWNFEGTLDPVIGESIDYIDGANGATSEGTEFGTTTVFGIPGMGGAEAMVMKFPAMTDETMGYFVPTGTSAQGSDLYVNEYTVIMDVLFPAGSSGVRRGLFQTDAFEDADVFISESNGIGVSNFSGVVAPDAWHRIAFVVNQNENTVVKFINGTKVGTETISQGTDGRWAVDTFFYLFNDDDGESAAGFIGSLQFHDEVLVDGLIEALGAPTADGIQVGTPDDPFVVFRSPTPEPVRTTRPSTVSPRPVIQLVLQDGEENAVVAASVTVELDDQVVDAVVGKTGNQTTITYQPNSLLPSLSGHSVNIAYQDDDAPANAYEIEWQFSITEYESISGDIFLPSGSVNTPGFLVRSAQAPENADIRSDITRALNQLAGTLKDAGGNAVADEALAGSADGYHEVNTINFEEEGADFGTFPSGDAPFPGIPGSGGHTRKFATEIITYLELEAGFYRFGFNVHADLPDQNDDDGFRLWVGADPRDAFAQVVGQFERTRLGFTMGDNVTLVDFAAPETGIYPFRLVYFTGRRDGAALEWFSEDVETGQRILINDPGNADSIRAFRYTNAASKPYIAEVSPAPSSSGGSPDDPLTIVIVNDGTGLNTDSIVLSVDGSTVDPNVTVDGDRTSIAYMPDATGIGQVTFDVSLTYEDNSNPANMITQEWMYSVDALQAIEVTGQWDFDRGDLAATIGNDLAYFDGPGGSTDTQTSFGTTSSFGIPGIDGEDALVMMTPASTSNNIGYLMDHAVEPNGGGLYVNQYTLIMDVYWSATGGFSSIVNLDDPTNVNDGDSFINLGNGGWGQGGGGYDADDPADEDLKVRAGNWYRLAIAADLSADPPQFVKYVNGRRHSNQGDRGVIGGLDGRQTMRPLVVLFGDNDGERTATYVNSIQVRNGQLTTEEIAALGGPSSNGIPNPSPIKGQWDFDGGDLAATIGNDLAYFDGPGGSTDTQTSFGTTSSFGIPGIDGEDALVMMTPASTSNNIGYLMDHAVEPNGGGLYVNQYTLIMDVYWSATGGFSSIVNLDDPTNVNDGDSFINLGNGGWGQGGGGYDADDPADEDLKVRAGNWYRLAIAADLSADPPQFVKYVNGRRHSNQGDRGVIGGLDGRQTMRPLVVLFGDNDGERTATYVNSIQVRDYPMSPEELALLGAASADGIPSTASETQEPDPISITTISAEAGVVTLSWEGGTGPFQLQKREDISAGNWEPVGAPTESRTATDSMSTATSFYRIVE